MNVEIIKPYGFCYGVTTSLKITKFAKTQHNNVIFYIFGPLIHNENVNEKLKRDNIQIIDDTQIDLVSFAESIDKNSIVILPAHGTFQNVYNILDKRNIKYYDSTCDIVRKINNKIKNYIDYDEIIYIGVAKHKEAIVSLSYAKKPIFLYDTKYGFGENKPHFDSKKIIINQSTLSEQEINLAYSKIQKDYIGLTSDFEICPFVNQRQINLKSAINDKDLFIIVGSKTSNNTKTLLDIYLNNTNSRNYLYINSIDELDANKLISYEKIFITSGTSAENELVENIYNYILKI